MTEEMKAAHKAKAKEYRAAHKAEYKAYQKEYRAAHKAEYKAYKQAHKEEAKEYREAHRDEAKEYNKFHKRRHYCCEDISKIENYSLAKADNFVNWDIHHRLETNNSDGEKRLVDLTRAELKELGVYYNRPASELIFMTHGEHISLHNKGRKK